MIRILAVAVAIVVALGLAPLAAREIRKRSAPSG